MRVCSCSKHARGSGDARRHFVDRETGELVDNGQHVLLGCYRETFAFLRDIGASDHVRAQPDLAVTTVDRDGRMSRLRCPRLPSPLHLVAGVFTWTALGWRDRLAVLRMAAPLRAAQRALAGDNQLASEAEASSETADRSSETVEQWLIRHGQTPRLRELLWDPLALAALNQLPDVAAAAPFARVLAEMFGPDPAAAAIVLPTTPLHLMYAEPARAYIEARGGVVRTGARACIRVASGAVESVAVGDEVWSAPAVVCAAPWFALPDIFCGDIELLRDTLDAARATLPSPIVTVNLWFDRVGDGRTVRRSAWPGHAVGVRQALGVWRIGVTSVPGVERRRGGAGLDQSATDRVGARRNCARRCRGVRSGGGHACDRHP